MSAPKGPRVLLVDDDPEFCKLMDHLLKKFGIAVVTTKTPEEFLGRLRRDTFDLALVDLNLGRDSVGILVIRAVRKVLGPEVPLYIVSGTHGMDYYRDAVAAGANDYILKPLDRRLLAAKLSQHFVTQEMTEWLDSKSELPELLGEASLDMPLKVLEVTEEGLKVHSPHLLLRGSHIHASGEGLREILLGYDGKVEFLVKDVWRESGEQGKEPGYIHLLEFDRERPDIFRAVRVWLMRRRIERVN